MNMKDLRKFLEISGLPGRHIDRAERFFRELRVDRIWEGTSEIQRLIIARCLIKRGLTDM